jgi:hypothetical protein
MEQRQQKNDIRTKESKDTITLAKSSDESAADKMMRFFTGKPCKERSKKSKAIKFPLKVRILSNLKTGSWRVSGTESQNNYDFWLYNITVLQEFLSI